MFILSLFEVYIFGTFFKYLFYGIVAFGIGWVIYKAYQHEKACYVLDNIEDVEKLEIIKPTREYKTVYEETGYSFNWRYYTTHYKAKRVPKPLVYKATAFFKNGKTVKFQIVENSEIYNELMNK